MHFRKHAAARPRARATFLHPVARLHRRRGRSCACPTCFLVHRDIIPESPGEAEAEVGDERGRLAAGDLAVVPAMVPHGLVNVGDQTVKVVGFFSESEITSSFDEPIQPIGAAVVNQGATSPAPA